MHYTDCYDIEVEDIQTQIRNGATFSCSFPFINRDSEFYLSQVLKIVLEEVNQGKLHTYLEYALSELSMNSSKANSKRLYFLYKGLDIKSPEQYEIGMRKFKDEVFNDFKSFEQLHYNNKSFVQINLTVEDMVLKIEILNNSPLLQEEKLRIAQRLKLAHKFNNLTEVLTHVFDNTEGAGFGLIIVLLMLRKINLDEKSFVFQNYEQISKSTLNIPLNLVSKEQGVIIADEIANELKSMPQFPESIVQLQRELSDPNCSFRSVSETINSDPSLSAEIIRIANSPVYRIKDRINNVNQAVSLIGMLGVKSILYNYGVNSVFQKKYNKETIKELNNHSFYVAIIASYLIKYKKLNRIAEDVYVSALLHDMGKIIVSSLNQDLEEKLNNICKEKHIPISILDDLTEGYNHALIGSEVAKKWNFPEKYVNAIRYHHIPLEVDDEFKAITYAVYIGNEIYYYIRGEREFNDLNIIVLKFFGLDKKDTFDYFIESLNNAGLSG